MYMLICRTDKLTWYYFVFGYTPLIENLCHLNTLNILSFYLKITLLNQNFKYFAKIFQ